MSCCLRNFSQIQHASACVREGVLWLLNFLPTAVKLRCSFRFSVIFGVVAGLGDDAETVRDTALKAGRVVVEQYAETSSATIDSTRTGARYVSRITACVFLRTTSRRYVVQDR